MIDLSFYRDNTDLIKNELARKKFSVDFDSLAQLDDLRRQQLATAEEKRAAQKSASKALGQLDKSSPEFQSQLQTMQALSAEVKVLEEAAKSTDAKWKDAFLTVPNIPHESVPSGKGDGDNQSVFTWGNPDELVSSHAVPHYDIPWFNDMLDFPRGVKVTGAGFPFYNGPMARLVRSLVAFFLDEARDNGYTESHVPLIVNPESALVTGALPDKEGQMYHTPKDDLYLIPTADVPLTSFHRDETFEEKQLPVYRCAYTPCFRREAGSWGKDVRGLNRLHQFDKVELVKWVHPETSFEELESLRDNCESLLQQLELPYRRLLICSGDLGFPHSKQYDLEVWSGGQQRWLEVSSCSNFTDFQARRAGTRFRPKAGGKAQIVHTLNGSGLAIPRVLAALLENNLQEDGRVKIPACLKPYFRDDFLAA